MEHTIGLDNWKPPDGLGFPPMGDIRLRVSWGRLRSSENGAYRRGLANWKPPDGLGFPPMGDI